ncbi:NUDIX hydrolase [Candidatus Entotheonella palauensis]|uniref:NUDIX hydrolase n=1 Tax=Candidatus Entotheonella palauensis TaxID=93172 RepID=UPI000B7F2610|nr:NUDIX domain-containing protein [Candidatus Entotheonella palauensis]
MQTIDKLAWLYTQDRRILCARSRGKETFYIPGGKREAGETDHDALQREIREELSVELVPNSLSLAGVFEAQADGRPAGTTVRMTCYFGDYAGTLKAASEIAEFAWLAHADWAKTSEVDHVIFDWLKTRGELR